MNRPDWFVSSKPAFPWSLESIGLPLLGLVAILLILFTLWTYRGHTQASRRRILIVLGLRLLALLFALLTAVRPTIGYREKPKSPTKLLIGIDLSESMTIADEFGSQRRIDVVRKILEKCQPTLDELQNDQNCAVTIYQFGSNDFRESSGLYDPKAAADFKRSDYGIYLQRTLQKYRDEKFIRGHLVIGDGADNGTATQDGKAITAPDQAALWRSTAPIQTFAVGDASTNQGSKDVAFANAVLDPDPVAVKNLVTVRARVNAFGYPSLNATCKVEFDLGKGYEVVRIEPIKLTKEFDNALEFQVPAPNELPLDENKQPKRQIKVRLEIPVAECPGDTNPVNNVVETYLNLNKEGLRVLVVDRYFYEYARILDALSADKRIDVRKVDLQTDEGGEELRQAFDFDKQAYDVLLLGDITPKQLLAIDPKLPEKIAERVKNKGMGLMMRGGHATLNGTPELDSSAANGWRGIRAIEEILPVSLTPQGKTPDRARYMVVPEPKYAEAYISKLGNTREESLQMWDKLNDPNGGARFTAMNRLRPADVKSGAQVYLWARNSDTLVDLNKPPDSAKEFPLLVGWQLGTESKSRVLVFAAQDTLMWQKLGQPKAQDGIQLHSRFWRQSVLWLAKQDEDDAAAFVRPLFPRLKVGGEQELKLGFKGPNGAVVQEGKFNLKVVAPGENPEAAKLVDWNLDSTGSPKAIYLPRAPGEYTALLEASGTVDGKTITGTATAKFLVSPDVSEEMQRTAANPELLKTLAIAGGGKAYRIEDLPAYLNELKSQPFIAVQPETKYIPDWRRDHSKGFLPLWLALFSLCLLTEWGLRRWWGLV